MLSLSISVQTVFFELVNALLKTNDRCGAGALAFIWLHSVRWSNLIKCIFPHDKFDLWVNLS